MNTRRNTWGSAGSEDPYCKDYEGDEYGDDPKVSDNVVNAVIVYTATEDEDNRSDKSNYEPQAAQSRRRFGHPAPISESRN
jgi:hypothetical protein